MKYIRNEYPRPQFRRNLWQGLNGEWEFAFDDLQQGETLGYTSGKISLPKKIIVPFTYEYEASSICETAIHEIVWYRRTFFCRYKDKHAILCFNGSDYITDVWLNGNHIITHIGGFSPFSVEVTKYLKEENVIVVKCFDPSDPTIPRGKQSWIGEGFGCWYIRNTGIWQSVWLDYVEEDYIESFQITPNIDTCSFSGEIKVANVESDMVEIKASLRGKLLKRQLISLDGKYTRYTVSLMEKDFVGENLYWSPDNPNLIDIDLVLYKDNKVLDIVHTRFGMRKIDIDEHGQICLNNSLLYQRLILDQGYWKESGITPISIEAIKEDIKYAKAMGFNGARKHQKFEDPYYYYYADELGFLTWCEMPSAYNYNADEIRFQTQQWQEIIAVARNFTSVICYVPLNESWGVRKILTDKMQQAYADALYSLTKALDSSRLISTNDGWENTNLTDIVSIHDYAFDNRDFGIKYSSDKLGYIYPQGRKLIARGCRYNNQPVIFSEFGGIAMKKDEKANTWGYGKTAQSIDEFYNRLSNLIQGIKECNFQGYCYTQLTDVQQEVNGLLDENHQPKVDIKKVRKIFFE